MLYEIENIQEQYKNKRKELVTYFLPWCLHWTPPSSKYHYWTLMHDKTLFKSFNNKNTTTEKKRDKEQIPTWNKKIGNNILVGYSLLDTKMEIYKEQYTNNKRRQKNWNWTGYVLSYMLVTLDTAHFETSLLNTLASLNAVQIIQ